MKTKTVKSIAAIMAIVALAATAFLGCSKKSAANGSASDKIKITVATGGQPKPFSFVDDKNEISGYDIDVVKAIFKELPQYDLAIEKTEFPSIFAGLDSDRYQVGANNFAMNDKRKEKYIYTNPIFKNQFVIAVAENRTDIKSFKDLLGKKTEVQPGINYTTALENYNKEHADSPVKINYSEADLVKVIQNVESGQYDFQLIDAAMLSNYIKEFGLKVKAIPLSDEDTALIGAPYSYLIVGKGPHGEQLTKDINATLDKLLKDGTISAISKKYFDSDFAPK